MEHSSTIALQSITPSVLRGTVVVPSSKSLSHRALILAALASAASGTASVVRRPLRSDDLDITLAALQAMGYTAEQQDEDVVFSGHRTIPDTTQHPVKLFMHHSGTSARLLTAIAAAQPFPVEIDGSARMRERPMLDLITPLEQLGARIHHERGLLPLVIESPVALSAPNGGRVRVNAEKSSQFLSALLQIGILFNNGLIIELEGGIASKSYSDMTIAQVRRAGVEVEELNGNGGGLQGYYIRGGQHYAVQDWDVEGDYSAASYPIAGAVITGGEVHIPNLDRVSLQGDSVMVEIAEAFGASIEWSGVAGNGVTVRSAGALRGIDRDMNSCPDIVPTVAVMAMFATTPTRLRNVEHLRYKESDRISAVIGNIERLGGKACMDGDAMVIEPVPPERLHSAQLPTFDDHRIAMCFALAGLRIAGVVIEDPACVAKSYPEFWRDFSMLTGQPA
jgi:3-phosphoshikimate 1-carboxyvinyltransferase